MAEFQIAKMLSRSCRNSRPSSVSSPLDEIASWNHDRDAGISSERPSRAELGPNKRVGLEAADGAHPVAIPLNRLPRAQRDVSKQERLRQDGRIGKRRQRRPLAEARAGPLVVMARRARQGGRW